MHQVKIHWVEIGKCINYNAYDYISNVYATTMDVQNKI